MGVVVGECPSQPQQSSGVFSVLWWTETQHPQRLPTSQLMLSRFFSLPHLTFSIPSFVLPRTPLKNRPALRYLFQSKTQSWSVDLIFKATGSQLWILKQGKICDLIYISESSLSEVQTIYYSGTGLAARTVGGCWVNLGRKWIFWRKKAYRKGSSLTFNTIAPFSNLGVSLCNSVNSPALFHR